MNLRIAIVKPDWGITGGFEFLMTQLSSRLEQAGHSIQWVLPRVDALGTQAFGQDITNLNERVPDFVRFVQLVERFSSLDVERADLVVSAMPGAYAVQHERHIAMFSHHLRAYYDLSDVLIEAEMVTDIEAHHRAGAHVRRIDARYLGSVPLILATSSEVAGRLASFNRLTHNVDLFLAGLGFQDALPEASSEDSFDHVLCVSRHEFPKRNELFVQAMQHVQGPDAISVGSGGRLGWAMQLDQDFSSGIRDASAPARTLWCTNSPWIDPDSFTGRGRITFAGHVPANDLDRFYRQALCVVAPAYLEDYGLTAIEAMSYGKALIVCNDGGNLVNFVEDGVNGFVVEPEGPAIAAAVNRLVEDRALAKKMGEAAREAARPYTWDRAMDQFNAGVDRVMSS